MAWKCGFHNSVDDDRTYNADDMSSIYDGLITDGIFPKYEDELKVSAGTGMKVIIATGKGWFNSRYGSNTTDYELELEASDPLLNRWAAVIVRGDNSDNVRDTYPTIIYSEFANEPTKPSLTREDYVYDYCLAYVYIKAGATAISDEDITDTRDDEDMCGYSAAFFGNVVTKETIRETILAAHPVGTCVLCTTATSPASTMGGTWELIDEGYAIISGSESGTYQVGTTYGSNSVAITEAEMPSHNHMYSDFTKVGSPAVVCSADASGGCYSLTTPSEKIWQTGPTSVQVNQLVIAANTSVGSGSSRSNMQSSYPVYVYKRTA